MVLPRVFVAQTEGVRDAPHLPGRVHHQDVEANTIRAPVRMLAQNEIARPQQPGLLSFSNGESRFR